MCNLPNPQIQLIRPGSQYDTGTMSITSIMKVYVPTPSQNAILSVRNLTAWLVGSWKHHTCSAGIKINSFPAPPSRLVQCNAGASIYYCELGLTHENDGLIFNPTAQVSELHVKQWVVHVRLWNCSTTVVHLISWKLMVFQIFPICFHPGIHSNLDNVFKCKSGVQVCTHYFVQYMLFDGQ